jgi:type II secretory pathway component GspD/PulD (secretin)
MAPRTGRPAWFALPPILALWLAALSGAPARGQETPAAATEGTQAAEPDLITLHADKTSLTEVLQILADRSGLNIVTGPGVQGQTISIRIRNTPFDEALNLVCRATGLGHERIGNSIVIADPEVLAEPTAIVTRVYDLQFAAADEVQKALQVISPRIAADSRSQRLVVSAPQSVVETTERAIRSLDRKPPQVLLEARLFEINTSKLGEYGIDWEKITKWTTIVSEGDPSEEEDFIRFQRGEGGRAYRGMESVEVTIDALVTDGAARVLADSKVVTLSGEPAEIFAGETVPVVITSLQSPGGAGGVLQTVQLEKIDIGVRLHITPRIADDETITTLVEPEVSRIVAFVGPDDDLPQTSTRRARTLVRVKNGQRIYMGGLLTEEKRRTIKRVPLLGHIPLLGLLFQHRREETIRLDLLIEITPRIVGDEGAALPVVEPANEEETDRLERLLLPNAPEPD